jgi:hypothetical protein
MRRRVAHGLSMSDASSGGGGLSYSQSEVGKKAESRAGAFLAWLLHGPAESLDVRIPAGPAASARPAADAGRGAEGDEPPGGGPCGAGFVIRSRSVRPTIGPLTPRRHLIPATISPRSAVLVALVVALLHS